MQSVNKVKQFFEPISQNSLLTSRNKLVKDKGYAINNHNTQRVIGEIIEIPKMKKINSGDVVSAPLPLVKSDSEDRGILKYMPLMKSKEYSSRMLLGFLKSNKF
mmetsp:Transcript_1193/g.1303  ORF Transcript_1193/g.1303 Transcript_1193/m.1303 type:complete len:104 (+) Transcript_1193:166-477(+)